MTVEYGENFTCTLLCTGVKRERHVVQSTGEHLMILTRMVNPFQVYLLTLIHGR